MTSQYTTKFIFRFLFAFALLTPTHTVWARDVRDCQALLRAEKSKLPKWYKSELKTQTQRFFESVDRLTSMNETPKTYSGITDEMQMIANQAHEILSDKNIWYEFIISLTFELAEKLYANNLLGERAWYISSVGQTLNSQELETVRNKVNPIYRELLKNKLQAKGFSDFTTVKMGLSREDLRKIFATGTVFWDDAFIDRDHGSEIHALQTLLLAIKLDERFGAGTGKRFYQYWGTEEGYQIFDFYLDGYNQNMLRPECVTPVLRYVLPER